LSANKTIVHDIYGESQTMIVPAADAALAVASSPAQKLHDLLRYIKNPRLKY